MRLSLAVPSLLACLGAAASAAEEFRHLGRAGLFGSPGFTEGRDQIHAFADNGWLCGYSGFGDIQGAWVTSPVDGVSRRVGLFTGVDFESRETSLGQMLENGVLWGTDSFSLPGGIVPAIPWVADGATGTTRKVGLTGGACVNLRGESSGYLMGITESGWATGWSPSYADGSGVVTGNHAVTIAHWVANAATGVTWRVGLTGPEFRSPSGRYGDYIERVTEGGKVFGGTTYWRGEDPIGGALWVTDGATGAVNRIGLTGGEFIGPDGDQSGEIRQVTESGYALGVSQEYYRTEYRPSPAWVADARTGQTRRLGLAGGVTPVEPLKVSEGGLVTGYTDRPIPGGSTAWVVDIKTGRETTFDLSVRESTGHAHSRIGGVTPGGIVHGYYTLYEGEANLGARPFLWAEGMGTLLPDIPVPGGPGPITAYEDFYLYIVKDQGAILGGGRHRDLRTNDIFFGRLSGVSGPGGVWITDLARLPDGKFRLSFSTDAPTKVTLQFSADITTWRDAQIIDAPAGASSMDIEPDAAAGPRGYWRLKTASAAP